MIQKHLVPQVVIDCVETMLDPKTNPNIRQNFEDRIEAIRKFCEEALQKTSYKKRR